MMTEEQSVILLTGLDSPHVFPDNHSDPSGDSDWFYGYNSGWEKGAAAQLKKVAEEWDSLCLKCPDNGTCEDSLCNPRREWIEQLKKEAGINAIQEKEKTGS